MNFCFRPAPRYLTLFASLVLLLPATRAGDKNDDPPEGSTARVTFSDPAKPGTLKLSLPWAEAHITGTDGNEVVVTSSLDQKGRAEVDDQGFRRLDEEATFELVEKDNVATITIAGDHAWAAHGAEFKIKVPRNSNLIIRTEAGGDILVDGVEGDLDINSMNGEVILYDIVSSAVVNTMNGEINARFKRAPVKPVSFSSMNGEIDVDLPRDSKANLRMRTHNGSIRTNFPDSVLQTKTEKVTRGSTSIPASASPSTSSEGRELEREMQRERAKLDRELAKIEREVAEANQIAGSVSVELDDGTLASPIPPIPPIPPLPNFGGKTIVGTLNGGGIDIKLTSMNGTITLRATK